MEKPELSDTMFLDSNGILLYDFKELSYLEEEVETNESESESIFLSDEDWDDDFFKEIDKVQRGM